MRILSKKLKSLRFDPFDYITTRNVSAAFLGTLVALWVFHPLLTVGLAIIGALLLISGEWYARYIKEYPMINETYKSVFYGILITGSGITLASAWINFIGASQWLQPFVWVWAFILTGGPMIYWQRVKKREQEEKVRKGINTLGTHLLDKKKD